MTYYHVPPNNVVIELLGRTYTIKCNTEEKIKLERAVEVVEAEMKTILQGHNKPSPEQLAIVAALNLAVKNDALQSLPDTEQIHQDQATIDALTKRCNTLLPTEEIIEP